MKKKISTVRILIPLKMTTIISMMMTGKMSMPNIKTDADNEKFLDTFFSLKKPSEFYILYKDGKEVNLSLVERFSINNGWIDTIQYQGWNKILKRQYGKIEVLDKTYGWVYRHDE